MDLPCTALSSSGLLLRTTFTLVDELARVSLSAQITKVPFTTLVVGVINNLDISVFPRGEILETMNEIEPLLTVCVCG